MRKTNAVVTVLIFILFLVHLIWGGLQLAGMAKGGNRYFSLFSYLLLLLIGIHVLVSVKLTADTVRAARKSGVFYWKQNRLFVLRRVSGLALLFFLAAHVLIFSGTNVDGVYRLTVFGGLALVTQLLMVVSLLVHLLTNIPPLKIALGLSDRGNLQTDVLLILACLLFLGGLAFFVYYLRWQVI